MSPEMPAETPKTPTNATPSRRHLLAAVPLLALTALNATACSTPATETKETTEDPPRPATPDGAIAVLMEGNKRFVDRTPQVRDTADIKGIWTAAKAGQEPFASILACADSRLGPELIFDQFVGDIFVVREAGNIADSPTNLGSLEFGQAVLKSKALMVLGHSDCGAVRSALDNATERNVRAVIDTIRAKSTLLREAEAAGDVKIVGAVYDIKTATVTLL